MSDTDKPASSAGSQESLDLSGDDAVYLKWARDLDLSLENFAAPLAVLGLMPEEGDREAIAKAAKSKDWVQRAAACLCEGITPGELKRLLDDEVAMVRQLAICRLRDLEVQDVRVVSA